VLATVACGVAALYLLAAARGASARVRWALLGLAALALVVLPTAAFIAMGVVTGRPYGQDGGVVQLPLAIDRILAGQSPYGADYSQTMLGRQARVSDFWAAYGGNPILRHHAYLPGTHLLMMPFVPLGRALLGVFDPRLVTLLAYGVAAWLAALLAVDSSRRLIAAAAVLVSPLVYWQQIFGANDILPGVLLLGAAVLAGRSRADAAAALVGLACATKQLAWPFAPFLLAHLSGARSLAELGGRAHWRRLARPVLIAAAVFVVVVAPVAAFDLRAFWGDIVAYNVGLPGADNYPLGGTPGFGVANLLIYFGRVQSLKDHVPFSVFYLLLVPLGVLLLRAQLRAGTVGDALLAGSAALLLSVYFSRVAHPNYLILAAVLVPAGLCAGARRPAGGFVIGLLLLLLAVEVAEGEVFRGVWDDVTALGARALPDLLMPRAGPTLTTDPLGLLVSAVAAALGIAFVVSGALGAGERTLRTLVVAALVLVVAVPAVVVIGAGDGLSARFQDAGSAAAWRAAHPLAPETAVREAWSTSFRREPAAALGMEAARGRAAGAAAAAIGVGDVRWLLLVAAGLVVVLLVTTWPSAWATVSGAILLGPAGVMAVVFGGSEPIVLALVLLGLLAARRRVLAAGLVGLASPLVPRVLGAAPAVHSSEGSPSRSLVVGLAGGILLVYGLWGGFTSREAAALEPGIGAANLWLYAGIPPGTPSMFLYALALATAGFGIVRAGRTPALAPALTLLVVWLLPSSSPDHILLPMLLALLGLSAAGDRRSYPPASSDPVPSPSP
jgi:hypothetical protein